MKRSENIIANRKEPSCATGSLKKLCCGVEQDPPGMETQRQCPRGDSTGLDPKCLGFGEEREVGCYA